MMYSGRWQALVLKVGLVVMAAAPATAITYQVNVQDFEFVPAQITVKPGDTVRFQWVNGFHTATSGSNCTYDGLYFDAPIDPSNTTFDFVVPSGVGQIPYFCRPHCVFMNMVGVINIDENALDLTMTLDGDQENPRVTTAANGAGTGRFYPSNNRLEWNISFSNLGSAQTAAHFHGAALPCANAGVQVGLPNGSPIVGSATLTPTQATDLLAGKWYVNVHTMNFPGGEIRGQVMPSALADPLTEGIPQGQRVILRSVSTGMTAPNWGTPAPGVPGRLYVADQNGIVWNVNLATGAKSVFLDVMSRLVPLGINGPNTFDERGLLSVAFHPNYAVNGLFYTFTSEPDAGNPDFTTLPVGATPDCQSIIAEWRVLNPGDPNALPDPTYRREFLRIDKPQFNHNGGGLVFGPDGLMYISLGDGGGGDDRDGQISRGMPMVGHGCIGNGQNTMAILGKLLRIDPRGNNSANGKYGIPATNPFVGGGGLAEIWAYGLRNPWRFSFDEQTGTLFCPDVGQNAIEEVNVISAGGNYGWRAKEGSFFFVFNGNQRGYVTDHPLEVPAGLIDPIAEYDHSDGIAVIGGFVYRGTRFPQIAGKYVFGEFARTFSNDGRLFYLDTGNVIKEFKINGQANLGRSLLGFGQDAAGELYVLANGTGTPFGTTGVVQRLVSAAGDLNCDGVVNFDDINPFVLALSDPVGYAAAYPDCDRQLADINGDDVVNFDDINPFVALLSGQ
ncbi:MAG: PQQ-dependent sugar dehydrogenase [Planctomycetota bacterium]